MSREQRRDTPTPISSLPYFQPPGWGSWAWPQKLTQLLMGNPASASQGSRVDSEESSHMETSSLPAPGHTLGRGGCKLSSSHIRRVAGWREGPTPAQGGLETGDAAQPPRARSRPRVPRLCPGSCVSNWALNSTGVEVLTA